MTNLLQQTYTDEQLYPSFDGNPMAENTLQYEWIVLIKENLERLFSDRDDVFIAGDLLWYPIRVTAPPAPRQAPDVMVVFGRPKGHRKSYRQPEEENIAPQVAFEILSDSNKTREGRENMKNKFAFYERYGIEEYYIYDPDAYEFQGWLRRGEYLLPIDGIENWVSPRLGIRFRSLQGEELEVFFPDGRSFMSPLELSQSLKQAEQQVEQERQKTERAEQQVKQAQQQAERAEQKAERAEQQVKQAQQQIQEVRQQAQIERLANEKFREKLRSLGIDPDRL